MGGFSSKGSSSRRLASSSSSSHSRSGYPQSPYYQPSHTGYAPQQHFTPPSQSYGGQEPESKKRLERKYSKIDDNYNTLEQVTEALARAGLESSNLIVGIDFTKSNEWTGQWSFQRRSLHHIGEEQNPYEQAISIIGKTLSSFDEDNLIPCFGFGDATTHDQEVFSFYPDEKPCAGFEEVLGRYKELVPQLRLAGPTSFAPVIEKAVTIVEQSGGQYHVLLIIADGQVTRSVDTDCGRLSPQERNTVEAIVKASEYPLSIILVGVGDGPWDMMREFDDNIPARAFDNFQFVNFTEIMSKSMVRSRKEAEFALAALMEIPAQYKATLELNILGARRGKAIDRVSLPPPFYSSASYSPAKPSPSPSPWALVAQLLQVENLSVGDEDDEESWLEIITSLSWEAATLLKPDMSKGGGMDPAGYVKVKCIASGHRYDSMVVKGVVCKKNVAHRRMTSRIERPRLLILGGALEYQRVSNLLSSFDTLLQQEMDHLKMAVAKIDVHHPDVLLVEKSVSRFAQEYLLAKDISLVLNIKRPLLERIARCTGAQIVPSIDNLSPQKLGYCDTFHVERIMEEHGTAGQGGKKLVKTLMYFDGCPKPLGCTILLRGASGDELKKVKHVIQYGIFAAYHLALETSFLADEGASLPELPLNSPITVALADKSSSIDRSISTIPGFTAHQPNCEPQRSNSVPSLITDSSIQKMDMEPSPGLPYGSSSHCSQPSSIFINSTASLSVPSSGQVVRDSYHNESFSYHMYEERNNMGSKEVPGTITSAVNDSQADHLIVTGFGNVEAMGQDVMANNVQNKGAVDENLPGNLEVSSLQQDTKSYHEEPGSSKEEFPPSPSDHQSILVSLSSRCVWKGTVCERSHLFRIKYYGSFDKPLGRFLRDHLFDQNYRCRSCEMPSEAHVHCYTHRQGTLTISVKKLPEFLLPGERDGKIWMWHRCLRCPRINGFPPATRRIVMSDAAWGLSFGKFLELSFSNHAAASRVASCGHSLHRDCLRFYGFGKMVACFRYASIYVHSVYLPPPKLDFYHENLEWIQKETNEVVDRAELLFSEVLNALRQIAEKKLGTGSHNSGMKTHESRRQTVELKGMLQREKAEFEESLQKTLNREVKKGHPLIDILEINRLRRQLLFQSYMWDHRLIYAASLDNNFHDELSVEEHEDKPLAINEKLIDANMPISPGKGFSNCVSLLVDANLSKSSNPGEEIGSNADYPDTVYHGIATSPESNIIRETQANIYASMKISNQSIPLETVVVSRALSDGQYPIMANLSDTLDAAWTGENHPGSGTPKDFIDTAMTDPSMAERLEFEDHAEDRSGPKVVHLPSPVLSSKSSENLEDSVSWLGMPFLNFYRSFNKNFLGSSQKLDTLGEYNPVYVSSFRELELQGGSRLLLPVGLNDIVVPVYDDEPTSIISYALVTPVYYRQLCDDGERAKDVGESVTSLPFFDSTSFQSVHSFDEASFESFKSLGSTDDSFLSMSGSRNSLILDPVSYTKALHARVCFEDDGPLGKVKYTVICYYAKRFDALRRICCPSELDFIRSLSRCKKWGAQGGKSNVFFAKSLDDRFIIKQVTKTELESFIKFAPEYFKYLSESIGTGSPTCLAKILGIYQVTSKHLKGGKETKMDVLVMENLLFERKVTRLYDLKGSARSRYNPDASGSNKVLLDQNLIEAMPTSPIFVGNKAKRLLERAVWNDTSFLASIDVMDYSLLVGVDEEKHELVLGIIDFMRQYTWDKHLETWVKASGILGGPKNASPTVISPKQYKKRFRKAMTTYFLMVPDQWSPPTIIPSKSQSDLCEENSTQGGNAVE